MPRDKEFEIHKNECRNSITGDIHHTFRFDREAPACCLIVLENQTDCKQQKEDMAAKNIVRNLSRKFPFPYRKKDDIFVIFILRLVTFFLKNNGFTHLILSCSPHKKVMVVSSKLENK